jgi:hypothetical protein
MVKGWLREPKAEDGLIVYSYMVLVTWDGVI